MNDEYYRDEPVYKIRPSNVKAKLKPMFKTENGYFSPYLLNKKPVPTDTEGYFKYFYMESYNTVEERVVGGKKQKITICRSRKKFVEVPIGQWKQLHYFVLKDYETARDEYEGTEYDVHKNDRYYNVYDFMLQQWDSHNHEQFWINAMDLERVLNSLSDEDLDIYLYAKEKHLKQKQIAGIIGKSESYITRRMKFIEDKIERDMIDDGELTPKEIFSELEYRKYARTGKTETFADVFVYDYLTSLPQEMVLRFLFLFRGQQNLIRFIFKWLVLYDGQSIHTKDELSKYGAQLYKKYAAKMKNWAKQLFIVLEIELERLVKRYGIKDSRPNEKFIKTVQKAAASKGMTVAQYRDKILFPNGKQKILTRFEQYFKLQNKSKK